MLLRRHKVAALSFIIPLIVMGFECPAVASVSALSFKELVQISDIVVVAQVESVHEEQDIIGEIRNAFGFDEKKIATARVIELWKGESMETVKYLASPTWTCDTAKAIDGERVVLFLSLGSSDSTYHITRSGRGRMPIRNVAGKEYATIWSGDVILPEGTPTVPGPKPEYSSFIRSVELSVLKDAVLKILLESMPGAD